MGSIYQSSYITIAAAGSNDSQGGCFLPRNVPKSAIIPETFMEIGPLSALVASPSNNGSELGDIDESPLQKRGWTFQERKLSARIIHWDTQQIFWECQEYRKAESGMETKNTKNFGNTLQLLERGVNGIYKVFYSPRLSQAQREIQEDIRDDDNEKAKKSTMAHASVEPIPQLDTHGGMRHSGRGLQSYLQQGMDMFGIELPIESSRFEDPETGHEKDFSTFELLEIMGEAADMYTRRRLTFGKDKLPALAGTATLVQSVTGDEYIAGHWRTELERSLVWIADARDSVLSSRPPLQRGPSWAWSSIDGHVTWDFPDLLGNEDSAVDFEIISVNPQGAEVNGPAYHENAWLELIGESLPAKWSGGCWRIASTIDPPISLGSFTPLSEHLRILDSSETVIGSWTHDHKLNALLPASEEIEGLTEMKLEQLTSWYSKNTSTLISLTAAYLGERTLAAENWKPDDKTLRAVALPEELLFLRGATRMVSTDGPEDPHCYEHDVLVLTPARTTFGGYIRVGVGTIRKDYWSEAASRRENVRTY
ncbi:heterokaryon incompatibility protein [Rutstroemia sp. NJR-2017a WRK4]|nr:heterokaryon incompatibility protein [Rutstroemia sp. NJR-2017a WRK4]